MRRFFVRLTSTVDSEYFPDKSLYRTAFSLVLKLYTSSPKKYGLSDSYLFWNISEHKVGTEELAHMEIVGTIMHQLTRCMSIDQIKEAGFEPYFVNHTAGVYPCDADGVPFDAKYIASTGDVLADLNEDLAAEQKARMTYDNILRLIDDPDVCDAIKFLRQRELVHYQRFGDALRIAQDNMNYKNFYGYNPAFDNLKNNRNNNR